VRPVSLAQVPSFTAAYPQFDAVLEYLVTEEEFLTAAWCMQYYAPLALPQPHPFQLVTYERLVCDGIQELVRLFQNWGIELPESTSVWVEAPSMTTKRHSGLRRIADPLKGWRKALTDDQVRSILRVVEAFELDFYSEDLEPDYQRLHDLSSVGAG